MIKNTSSYPIEMLKKSRAVLETNIKGVPGMIVTVDAAVRYQRQIREVDKAIQYLELLEKAKRTKKQGASKQQ